MTAKRIVAWDLETFLIEQGNLTPKLVCMSASGGADTLAAVAEYLGAPHPATYSAGPKYLTCHVGTYTGSDFWLRTQTDGTWELVVPATKALDLLLHLVDSCDVLVAHNGPFDWLVMCNEHPELLPVMVALMDMGHIADTKVREMLYCIGKGWFTLDPRTGTPPKGFSLAHLVKARFTVDLGAKKKGNDIWRLRYSELDGVPLNEWPDEPCIYAAEDSSWTYKVYQDQSTPVKLQEGVLVSSKGYVTNEGEQTCADMALHAMACWGVRTDAPYVKAFEKYVRAQVVLAEAAGQEAGFMVINKCKACEGTGVLLGQGRCDVCQGKDHDTCNEQALYGRYKSGKAKTMTPPSSKTKKSRLQALVNQGYGGCPPMTEYDANTHKSRAKFKPQIKTNSETLAGSGNPLLEKYAAGSFSIKLLNNYLPILESGIHTAITSYPNVLVRTGRTSWSKPNFQNPPRNGGFRDCFIPRAGMVFASIDYSAVELCTLAQVCLHFFGESTMAVAINAGQDLHVLFAVELMAAAGVPITYDEAMVAKVDREHPRHKEVKAFRQRAKAANFGFPGGLGVATFITTAKGSYGLELSFDEAAELKAAWLRMWPEMKSDYFPMISEASGAYGTDTRFTAKQLGSNRLRGGCGFTSGANTYFQGLAADGAKFAAWLLFKAMYVDTESVLYGVRSWAFVHDEFLFEGPEETAHLWAPEASRIMVEAMRKYTPDVKIEAEPALMRRWYKDAEAVYIEGRLVPWEK
jgi:DNA polymerase-1